MDIALLIARFVLGIGLAAHGAQKLFGSFGDHGMELPLVYCMGAMLVAVIGPGQYSLDSILHLEMLWNPAFVWGSIAIAIVVGFLMLTFRNPHSAGSHGTQVPNRQ